MFRFYKLFPRFRNKTPQSIKPLMPLPPSALMNEASRTHRDSETEMRLKPGSRTCTYLIPVPSLGAGNHCLGGETLYSGHCQGLCEYLRSDCLQLRQPSAPSVCFHSYHVKHHQDFISTSTSTREACCFTASLPLISRICWVTRLMSDNDE